MAYPLLAIYDMHEDHVGFLDGPFVLDRQRHVVAEWKAGVVVRIDGRVPGTFRAECFLDAFSRVVAVTRRALPVPPRPFAATFRVSYHPTAPTTVVRPRVWSRLSWRQYIQF